MQLLKHARVKYVLGDMCLARVILLPGDQGCLSSLTHTYTHTNTHTHTHTHSHTQVREVAHTLKVRIVPPGTLTVSGVVGWLVG